MLNIKKISKKIGPGLVTGAADDDPSGIATYSQTGAKFGYGFLWMSVFTLPMMYAIEEMCARIAMTTGRGLASIMKQHTYRPLFLTVIWLFFVVNLVNIGANLGAMAEATTLLLPGPEWIYLLLFAGGITVLEVFVSYRRYTRFLRWLVLGLGAYILTAFLTGPDWPRILTQTFIPSFMPNAESWMMIVAILGTTIAPYLFFWQAAEEVEEEIDQGRAYVTQRKGVSNLALKEMRLDVFTGMLLSNIIMFFIILTTAGTLFAAGINQIETAAQAANALRPLAGDWAFLLFAIGIIGTGLIGVPVLAGSAAFAMAEAYGWREGLEVTFRRARQFNITIIVIIFLGMLVNMLDVPPIRLLIIAAVLNGLLAPVMIWFIVRFADRKEVVGPHRSPRTIRWLGWSTFIAMAGSGLGLIWQWISNR